MVVFDAGQARVVSIAFGVIELTLCGRACEEAAQPLGTIFVWLTRLLLRPLITSALISLAGLKTTGKLFLACACALSFVSYTNRWLRTVWDTPLFEALFMSFADLPPFAD